MMVLEGGKKVPELKRKKVFEKDICTAKGCQNTTGLTEYADFGPKGKVLLCPTCRAKVGGDAPVPTAPAVPEPHRYTASTEEAQTKAELALVEQEAGEALAEVRQFEVGSDEDLAFAAEILADVKGKYNRVEAMEKSATKPINDALKTIRSWFKPAKERLTSIEYAIKQAIGKYTVLQAGRRQEALKQLGDASSTAETASAALSTIAAAQAPVIEGLTVSNVWDFVVIDPSAVPVEYLSVDETKIRAAVKSGIRAIAGVSIFEKPRVASRSTS